MRLGEFFRCMSVGRHDWRASHKKPGYETCARCRTRRKLPAGEGGTTDWAEVMRPKGDSPPQ